MGISKLIGLPFIVLILISTLAVVPSTTVSGNPVVYSGARVNITGRYTFDALVNLAYTVRNISYPMFNWSISNNSTVAKIMLKLGDTFLKKAVNLSSTNTTAAKILAMVAAIHYAHAPASAYEVLGKTIRGSLGANYTITNETVNAVIVKALEVKNVLGEAVVIASDYNFSKPPIVDILVAKGDSYINLSINLLNTGYVKAAFRAAVKAYHFYVKAYGVLLKAVFIIKLDLPRRYDEPLTPRLMIRKYERRVFERLLWRMPKWIVKDVMKKIREGNITSWEELKEEIKEKIREFRERYMNLSIDVTTNILFSVIVYSVYNLPSGNSTHDGVINWLQSKGLMVGPMVKFRELRRYLREFVVNISSAYNVYGLRLLNVSLTQLELEIEAETSIDVDLTLVLGIVLTYHIHHGGGHGHGGHEH